jgi:uncharacterized protein (DUF2062 family)
MTGEREWKPRAMNWDWVLKPTFAPQWYFGCVLALSVGVALGLPPVVGYVLLGLCAALVLVEYVGYVVTRYRRERRRVVAARRSEQS